MSYSQEDYQPILDAKKIANLAEAKKQRELARQVAVVMSDIQGDPRWKVYADHIEGLRQTHESLAKSYQDRLNSVFLTPDDYGKTMFEKAKQEGIAIGLSKSLGIIKDLIDRGKEPEKEESKETS